jgi:hypothetical protein
MHEQKPSRLVVIIILLASDPALRRGGPHRSLLPYYDISVGPSSVRVKCSSSTTYLPQRVAQSRSSSDATTKPAAVTGGTVSLRAMAAAGPPRYGPCALQSADEAGSSGGRYMCGFGEAKGAAGTAVWIGRAMHGSPKRRGKL